MARASGPTIARWQLGGQLRQLREKAAVDHAEIAAELGCSASKIYKIESGDVGTSRSDVIVMLNRYGITDERQRQTALDLQKQGKERGWWAKYGQLPNPYSMYIGLESAATAIRNFELAAVPGLLQTEDYTRALFDQQRLNDSPEELSRRLQVRMARQECLVEDPPVQLWAIIDEGALRRVVGGPAVMRAQLEHLVTLSQRNNINVQALPFSEGAHPGMLGSVSVLEFPEEVHTPVAYVESFAGDVYLEKEEDMRRVTVAYTHLHSSALSAAKTRDLIAAIAHELT
ncbi:helix-turn-helix domain-containing protein [Micromonospora sp. NBC_01796]|uniref:helix-turn-helix domain-containing protein n=1 Tax=Micromonospora sp. NBC_01796 TaxID=2975987 RepID=UPI002DD90BBC|nr:helix-turn-helix transcriptional regulator [Micromonospora sp. NBC_01796]WSA86799.1 helix-turn-helix domain-containing protein [Micromonospora sp. NBC_01796]